MIGMSLAIGFSVLGILLLAGGVKRLWRGRIIAAGGRATLGSLFVGVGALTVAVSTNLYTYLPMADGATFHVSVTQSGLIARPANDAARTVTSQWN